MLNNLGHADISMTYKVIAFITISLLAGIRKPIYGGLAGMVTAPGLSLIFNSFDLPTVVVLAPFGFGFGLIGTSTGIRFTVSFLISFYIINLAVI